MKSRWLARASFVLMLAAAAVLIGFAELASFAMVIIGVIGACLMLGGAYEFLAQPRDAEVDSGRRGDRHPDRHLGGVRTARPHLGRWCR
jgi:hypothetical protein